VGVRSVQRQKGQVPVAAGIGIMPPTAAAAQTIQPENRPDRRHRELPRHRQVDASP